MLPKFVIARRGREWLKLFCLTYFTMWKYVRQYLLAINVKNTTKKRCKLFTSIVTIILAELSKNVSFCKFRCFFMFRVCFSTFVLFRQICFVSRRQVCFPISSFTKIVSFRTVKFILFRFVVSSLFCFAAPSLFCFEAPSLFRFVRDVKFVSFWWVKSIPFGAILLLNAAWKQQQVTLTLA